MYGILTLHENHKKSTISCRFSYTSSERGWTWSVVQWRGTNTHLQERWWQLKSWWKIFTPTSLPFLIEFDYEHIFAKWVGGKPTTKKMAALSNTKFPDFLFFFSGSSPWWTSRWQEVWCLIFGWLKGQNIIDFDVTFSWVIAWQQQNQLQCKCTLLPAPGAKHANEEAKNKQEAPNFWRSNPIISMHFSRDLDFSLCWDRMFRKCWLTWDLIHEMVGG